MAKYIYVKSNRNDNRVALSEVDDLHPGGSAFVAAGTGAVKVGVTPFVRDQLMQGHLIEVDDSAEKKEAEALADEKLSDAERAVAVDTNPDVEPMEEMTVATLTGMARDLGATVKQGMTKSEVIDSIKAKRAEGLTPTPPETPVEA